MSLDELRITSNPNSSPTYTYIIGMVDEVTDTLEKPATTFTLPGESYKNNQLMGISGMENEIKIYWRMYNDGSTDYSNGTYTNASYGTTINTIVEQVDWFKNYVYGENFSDTWYLTDSKEIYGPTTTPSSGLECHITNLDIPTYSNESPKWRDCMITVTVGKMVF